MPRLVTDRLDLIASTPAMVRSELFGDGALTGLLKAQVHPQWPWEHWDRGAMEWTLRNFDASPETARGWGMWYFVLRPVAMNSAQSGSACAADPAQSPGSSSVLIGNGGFKGPPNASGEVEIGYSIVPEHRRKGLATEACRTLLSWALRDARVRMIAAETFPELIPSLGVMRKLGMRHIGAGSEPGVVRFGVRRDEFRSSDVERHERP